MGVWGPYGPAELAEYERKHSWAPCVTRKGSPWLPGVSLGQVYGARVLLGLLAWWEGKWHGGKPSQGCSVEIDGVPEWVWLCCHTKTCLRLRSSTVDGAVNNQLSSLSRLSSTSVRIHQMADTGGDIHHPAHVLL